MFLWLLACVHPLDALTQMVLGAGITLR